MRFVGVALVVVLGASCSGGGEEALPVADAAAAVTAAVAQGDDLAVCPFGDTGAFFAAVPDDVPLNASIRAGSVEDYGQVFSGGDVDITYCDVVPDPFERVDISEIRIDASAGDVDVDTYLDEEFTSPDDVTTEASGSIAGVDVSVGCWDDGGDPVCSVFWPGDGLFVAVTSFGATAEQARAIGEAVIPDAVRNLAA